MIIREDDRDGELRIPGPARRIDSLVPGIAETLEIPSAQNGRIYIAEGELLSWCVALGLLSNLLSS